jgi:FlaA1/EpsC-like NDP-sugar epimerase
MVRFGNVLGSAASVLTIWSQQIAEGGPVTITDPRMTRYFMTIPEAATLVVQSTVLGSGDGGVGVYVLDMGRPVRIVDLALRFVRAHGLSPRVRWETAGGLGEDVRAELERAAGEGAAAGPSMDVVFTGIRPGEKLHEELAYAAEQLRPTAHPGVRSWAGPGFEASRAADVARMVRDLHAARHARDRAKVIEAIRAHVPEMRPSPAPGPPADHPAAG